MSLGEEQFHLKPHKGRHLFEEPHSGLKVCFGLFLFTLSLEVGQIKEGENVVRVILQDFEKVFCSKFKVSSIFSFKTEPEQREVTF